MAEDTYYTTISPKKVQTKKGKRGYLVIITRGKYQEDNRCIICSLNILSTRSAAKRWARFALQEREWENETDVFEVNGHEFLTTEEAAKNVGDLLSEIRPKTFH